MSAEVQWRQSAAWVEAPVRRSAWSACRPRLLKSCTRIFELRFGRTVLPEKAKLLFCTLLCELELSSLQEHVGECSFCVRKPSREGLTFLAVEVAAADDQRKASLVVALGDSQPTLLHQGSGQEHPTTTAPPLKLSAELG